MSRGNSATDERGVCLRRRVCLGRGAMRLAMLLVCLARFLPAQTAGGIEGLVTSSDGKPLAGARVSISASGGKQDTVRRATTNESGSYRVADLEPGNYNGKFEADNF